MLSAGIEPAFLPSQGSVLSIERQEHFVPSILRKKGDIVHFYKLEIKIQTHPSNALQEGFEALLLLLLSLGIFVESNLYQHFQAE